MASRVEGSKFREKIYGQIPGGRVEMLIHLSEMRHEQER